MKKSYLPALVPSSIAKNLAASLGVFAAGSVLSLSSAQAATYYWDSNGATANFGTATGTWTVPTAGSGSQGWSTDSAGTTDITGNSITTTFSDSVNFGTATASSITGGVITITGTVQVGSITQGAGLVSGGGNGITLGASAGAGTIQLGGDVTNNSTAFDSGNPYRMIINSNVDLGSTTRSFTYAGSNNGFQLNGVVSGTGGLTSNTAAGFIFLRGANTYTGDTTIGGGVFRLLEGGTLGAGNYAGNISNAGTIQYRTNAAQTFSGIISGTGALVKETSTSVLTLTGANTYTGLTTVGLGTLATGATGKIGGNITLTGSATTILTLGNNASLADTATLTFATLNVINLNFTGSDTLATLTNGTTTLTGTGLTYTAAQLNTIFGGSTFSGTGSLTIAFAAVPEPTTTAAAFALGLAIMVGVRVRRNRAARVA